MIIWIYGLSGSGKSTLAKKTTEYLSEINKTILLDADDIRHGLNIDLGFYESDKKENVRRLVQVSNLLYMNNIFSVVACITPYLQSREYINRVLKKFNLIGVYLQKSIKTLKALDYKGLYRSANNKDIKNLAGIDSEFSYENNIFNENVVIDTDSNNKDQTFEILKKYLKEKIK